TRRARHDLTGLEDAGGQPADVRGLVGAGRPAARPRRLLRRVAKAMGGLEKTREFFRFFIAPGMGHCTGGPGPNQFDALGALEQWVERGIPPERLIASHSTNRTVDRTRPLCVYPQVARWKGPGSSDEAANSSCVPPPPLAPAAKTTTTGGAR